MEVGPEHRPAYMVNGMEQVMVVVPVDGEEDEAHEIGEELGSLTPSTWVKLTVPFQGLFYRRAR